MSKIFEPADVNTPDYRHVGRPLKSSEREVWLSTGATLELAEITLTGANTLTFSLDNTETAQLAAAPGHLCVMVDGSIPDAGANIVFTVTGTDAANAVISATATFFNPAYSKNTKKNFPRCWSVSCDQAAAKKFKTITGITVVNNVLATGGRFKIFSLPDIDTFQRVGCIGSVGFTPRGVTPFSMRCGDNPQAFVVEGDLVEGRLTINAKYFNMTEGLARLNGTRCCAMIRDLRGRRVVTEQTFCTGYYPVPGESGSEGPEAVVNDSDAPIEESLRFAPGPAAA